MIGTLVKVKEFTEFWKMWLNELYELEKSVPPFQGDELIPEIKNRYSLANFFIDREEQDKDRFFMEVMKNAENIPLDLKAPYLTLNAEVIQEWIKHIGYLRQLKSCVESNNATFSDFEWVLDRAFDYFIDTYDGMSGALRCMKIDKSIREILSDEEAQTKFGFLTDAFKYGAPPHGGMGIGLDRLCMLLIGAESLRDVIAFPKMQNARELMSGCPSPCDEAQLEDLGINIVKTEE